MESSLANEDGMSSIFEMGNEEHEAWLRQQMGAEVSDDEMLADLVSRVLREQISGERAQGLIDVANLCLAMADRTLGANVTVARCLELTRH